MTPTGAGTSTGARPRLPWLLLGLTYLMVPAMVAMSLGEEPAFDTLAFGAIALTFATTGALVASRHPRNAIGWIFCGLGVWGGALELWESFAYHALPTADMGSWLIGWSWIVDGCLYALVFLLFPTGHLVTPRWRWVGWLLLAACLLAVPGQAFSPDNKDNPWTVDSPTLEAGFAVGMVLLLGALAGAVTSLGVRYRRSRGVERLQIRQLLIAGMFLVPAMVVAVLFYYESVLAQAATALVLVLLPTAVAVSMLRYRLYDIDVVINRALVYGSLTATLAATYLGSVLLLQLALAPLTEGSGLTVAASTLAVAALFRPARSRIQHLVDRRFFRSRYDAARTVDAFAAHLRDEVDLTELSVDLRQVVVDTMRPVHVSMWLRSVPWVRR